MSSASDARTALVGWVSDLLITGWRRQEAEGRYRGADDFRALHIDPDDALAGWRSIGRRERPVAVRPWPTGCLAFATVIGIPQPPRRQRWRVSSFPLLRLPFPYRIRHTRNTLPPKRSRF